MAEEMQEPVRGENLPPGSAPTTLTPGAVMSGLSLPVRVYPLPDYYRTVGIGRIGQRIVRIGFKKEYFAA